MIEVGSKQLENERDARHVLAHMMWNRVPNNGMAVPKRQTAWDILTKMALKTVPHSWETGVSLETSLKLRVGTGLPNNGTAVPKRQTAWDILAKIASEPFSEKSAGYFEIGLLHGLRV